MSETEVERLVVRLLGDASSYQEMLEKASKDTSDLANKVKGAGQGIEGMGSFLQGFAGSVVGAITSMLSSVGIQGIGGIFQRMISLSGEAEKSMVSFEVLLGNVEKAKKRVEELTHFADVTPFESGEVIKASRMLQVFGGTALATGESLIRIGDVAAGTNNSFEHVAETVGRAYDALKSGKPLGHVATSLGFMGVASRGALDELSKLAEKGASFSEVWGKMTKLLDRFKGSMDKLSQTLFGLFSTLKDNLDQVLREIGNSIVENFDLKEAQKGVIEFFKNINDWFKGLDKDTKKAIFQFLAAATAATALVGTIVAVVAAIALIASFITGPILLIVGAIVAAIAAFTWWIQSMGGVKEAFKVLWTYAMAFWDNLKKAVVTTWQIIKPVIERLRDLLMRVWNVILPAAQEAFDYLSLRFTQFYDAAVAAWEWMLPVRRAFLSFIDAVWEQASNFAVWLVNDFVVSWKKLVAQVEFWAQVVAAVFNWLTKEVNWQEVMNSLVEGFIMAEFMVRDFKRSMAFVWSFILMKTAEVGGALIYFFGTSIPTIAKHGADELVRFFDKAFQWIGQGVVDLGKNLIHNFGAVFKNIGLLIVDAFNWLIQQGPIAFTQMWNEIVSLSQKVFNWLTENVPKIFGMIWDTINNEAKKAFTTLATGIVELFKSIPDIVAQKTTINDVIAKMWGSIDFKSAGADLKARMEKELTPLPTLFDKNTFKSQLDAVPDLGSQIGKKLITDTKWLELNPFKFDINPLVLPDRQLTEWEKETKKDFLEKGGAIIEDYKKFREKKWLEFMAPEKLMEEVKPPQLESKSAGEEAGQSWGEGFAKSADKELKKLDAVLFDSLEAKVRFSDYLEHNQEIRDKQKKNIQNTLDILNVPNLMPKILPPSQMSDAPKPGFVKDVMGNTTYPSSSQEINAGLSDYQNMMMYAFQGLYLTASTYLPMLYDSVESMRMTQLENTSPRNEQQQELMLASLLRSEEYLRRLVDQDNGSFSIGAGF